MIKVIYHRNHHRLTIEGHACSGEPGHDLVCASASILAYTLGAAVANMSAAKQIRDSRMNNYFETLDKDLDALAGNIEQGRYELGKQVEQADRDVEAAAMTGKQYSIRKNIVDVNGVEYDAVVELEYKIFNRVKRSGKAYVDFVRNNLIKQKITVFDVNGDSEIIEFAGEKERVLKDGAKNKHPVIGELTQAKNETKKLVIVNAVETAEISRFSRSSTEHMHQWLDENGWEERTSHVMTKDGTIYPVTLHIAKAKDGRNILYDVNVKIKEGIATDKIATSLKAQELSKQAVRIAKPSEKIVSQGNSKSQVQKQHRGLNETQNKAVEVFGTTTDFNEVGFILPSGEMLKFTDDKHKGERQYDHRAIGMAYGVDVDLDVNRGYNKESNKHLDDFVENGGIRFDPGSLEFNFDAMMQVSKSVPLTKEQERAIRDFVEWKKQREDQYNPDDDPLSLYRGPLALRIDFGNTSDVAVSADRGSLGIASLTYEGGQINASRIISDIRHYYETGEVRQPSETARFRYQRRTPSYTDREVLELAAEDMSHLKLTDGERGALDIFTKRLDNLKSLEQQRDEQRRILADLNSAAKPNEDEIRKTKNRLGVLGRKIKTAEAEVLSLEDKKVLKKVLHTARRVVETEQRSVSRENRNTTAMRHKVRDIVNELKDKKKESIDTLASNTQAEVEEVGGKKKFGLKSFGAVNSFLWNNFKPVYAFKAIGSKTLSRLFDNVRAGEDTWAKDVSEAKAFYLEQSKKYGYDSWKLDEAHTFTSTTGMDFKLTLEQIMSLYAYSKRKQAEDHLKYGGIVFENSFETKKLFGRFEINLKTEDATAYNISPETLAAITGVLTADQKAFVDAMQEYLSTTMGEKGNEVSLEMYGVKLFKEKFYFPLKSAPQYMAKAREQAKGEVKIKNSGFTKETNPKAKNPIVLESFMDVWANHVNDMSMYHAFTLALEDFYRVYNYRTPSVNENMPTEGVNPAIQNAYGKAATKYIEQLLKDINGGARSDPTAGFINKMMGLFKKGAVFASASVVIQQPSAVARAMALIDSKYFIGKKLDSHKHKALWEEVKQYAPVAMIKEMGYFDTNMGMSTVDFIKAKEYESWDEKMKALVTDSGYRDELLSKAPALADELAWCMIWEAVKRETIDKHPALKTTSEEFLQLAGARFTEVIVNTQVYDSVLSRSANMRSKDTGMKMATAFLAEPTTNINMIADALIQGKRGDGKQARKAIGAVMASQILNAILVSFVYAARDDDEEKTYWEKYFASLLAEVKDSFNLANYIPFLKDIVSIVQGYDVERSDIAVIADIWKAYEQLDSDKISGWRKVENFVGGIAQLFGLPVKNIMRDARALYQTVELAFNGESFTSAGAKYAIQEAFSGKSVSNGQQLLEALMKGDEAHAERVRARFEDESKANTAVREEIRERYKAGELDSETALEYFIEYGGMDGGDVKSQVGTWYRDGEITKQQATSMLTKYADMKPDEVTKAITQWSAEVVTGIAYADIKQSYLDGEITESRAVEMRMKYGGYDRESAEATVAGWTFEKKYGFAYSDRAEAYADGEISRDDMIKAIMEYKGVDEAEATYAVNYLEFKIDYPQYSKLSEEQFATYYYGVDRAGGVSPKDAGIDLGVYARYKLDTQGIQGIDADGDGETDKNSTKNQILPIIDALPISSEQKDILYLQRWAISGIRNAPWH